MIEGWILQLWCDWRHFHIRRDTEGGVRSSQRFPGIQCLSMYPPLYMIGLRNSPLCSTEITEHASPLIPIDDVHVSGLFSRCICDMFSDVIFLCRCSLSGATGVCLCYFSCHDRFMFDVENSCFCLKFALCVLCALSPLPLPPLGAF